MSRRIITTSTASESISTQSITQECLLKVHAARMDKRENRDAQKNELVTTSTGKRGALIFLESQVIEWERERWREI